MIPVERLLFNWVGMAVNAIFYLVSEFISFVAKNVAFKLVRA